MLCGYNRWLPFIRVSVRMFTASMTTIKRKARGERRQWGDIDLVVATDTTGAAISRSQFTAKFEPSVFGRKSSKDIDEGIEKLWEKKCMENPRLYDGSKFRLADWRTEEGRWELSLGLTSYKELCGTNLTQHFQCIQDKGMEDFGNPQAYMSDTLGVGLLAITSDQCLVVTRRAGWTAEYPGALDRPGGHPEPSNVFQDDGSLKERFRRQDASEVVTDEVWWSAVMEAEAEIGLRGDQVDEVRWLGVDFNMAAGDVLP